MDSSKTLHNVGTRKDCKVCGKTFQNGLRLKIHQQQHPKTPHKHVCTICGKSWLLKSRLTSHMLNHTKAKSFTCSICSATFDRPSGLSSHMIVKHNVGVKLKCAVCNQSCTTKSRLETHMRVHTNEKPFKCSLCPIAYKQSTDLKRHINSFHLKQKPCFPCETCGKSYSKRFLLNAHLLDHSGKPKPYPCSDCDRSYILKSALKHHIRSAHTHANERLFPCAICGKAFRSNRHRDKHTSGVHFNERPSKSKMCGKEFRNPQNLKLHFKTHSKLPSFACPKCSLVYTKELDRSRHYLLEHLGSHENLLKCLF